MNWWHYLLLVNIYLTLFYGFYALLLRRETFFQLNRVYLVGSAILSFFIPLIQSQWVKSLFITQQVQYTIYGSNAVSITGVPPLNNSPLTIGEVLLIAYTAGVVILALKLLIQLVMLRRIIKDPSPSISYSFFNRIKVRDGIDKKEVIENHELVHAKQFHSADILVIEAVIIINWFNPIVYLYRFAIKHVHEYIADKHTLDAGTNKADYAMLLLSQTFDAPAHQLVNPFFNHSLLKQRIMMLQKNRSQRIKLTKYGLSAPLFILMLILSSATIGNSKTANVLQNKAEKALLSPAENVLNKSAAPDLSGSNYNEATINDTIPAKKSQAKYIFEVTPHFPGGQQALDRFLAKNIKYPAEARNKKIEGRCIVSFIVEPNGSLSDVKVIRPIGGGADEEALRVIKMSPKWMPAKQNGEAVSAQFSIPINFALNDGSSSAVVSDKQVDAEPLFTAVEQAPSFPGGEKEFSRFLAENIKYPKAAKDANLQGEVIATFVVEKDGSLSKVKVVRGVGMGIDEEAVRVLQLSPNWKPGVQNGHVVRVSYAVPIKFVIPENDKATKVGYQPVAKPFNFTDTSQIKLVNAIKSGKGGVPLYLLDGKVINQQKFSTLKGNNIESISVYKDKASFELYGKDAENGVIVVKTKRAK